MQHTLNKTSALFKTMPRLTGDIKIVMSANNKATMKSLNTDAFNRSELQYSNTVDYASNVSAFLRSYVTSNKYLTKLDNLAIKDNVLVENAIQQYDYNYQYGAKFSTSSKKHEFFAPIWITDKNKPKHFVIAAIKNSGAQRTFRDILKFDIIKTYDLDNGMFDSLYTSITSQSLYRNEPMLFNENFVACSGIDIATGSLKTVSTDNSLFKNTEYSLLEYYNRITNLFASNQLIVQNLVNMSFEFELSNYGSYDVVGFYCDDVNEIDYAEVKKLYNTKLTAEVINANNRPDNIDLSVAQPDYFITSNIYESRNMFRNALSATFTMYKSFSKDGYVDIKRYVENDAKYVDDSIIKLRTLTKPAVSKVSMSLPKTVQFKMYRTVAVGDYIAIVENDKTYKVYCDATRNNGQFFAYNSNKAKQIQNINDALQRLDTSHLINIDYSALSNIVTINASTSSDIEFTLLADTPDAFVPLSFTSKITVNSTEVFYEFSKRRDISNSLVIKRNLENIDVADISQLTIAGLDTIFTIVGVVISGTDVYLILDNELPEIVNAITLYNVKHNKVCQLSFYDVYAFDNKLITDDYSIINMPRVHVQLLKSKHLEYADYYDALLSTMIDNDYKYFVSNVTKDAITYSNNPFDKLKEYDVQQFALFSKINNGLCKWNATTSNNVVNAAMIPNLHIQFGQSNLAPVFDYKGYHDYHSYQYDYFLIGLNNVDNEQGYTSAIVTSKQDIQSDLFIDKLVTKYEEIVNNASITTFTELFVTTYSKNSILDKCYAMFRGVEYELPYQFKDYRFAVVHCAVENDKTFEIITNHNTKLIVIAIFKKIQDFVLTDNITQSSALSAFDMRRYMYYVNHTDPLSKATYDRYYDITFNEFYKFLDSNDSQIKVTKPFNAVIKEYLDTTKSGLSTAIVSKDAINKYVLQRYSMQCTPAVNKITSFANYAGYRNVAFVNNIANIYDYGIMKIGDANTLTTDDINNEDVPVHYLAGETTYDLVTYSPIVSSTANNYARFYSSKSTFNYVNSNEVIANSSNLISTLHNANISNISKKFMQVSSIDINVLDLVANHLRASFSNKTDAAFINFAKYILECYKFQVVLTNSDTNELIQAINSQNDAMQTTKSDELFVRHFNFSSTQNVTVQIEFS